MHSLHNAALAAAVLTAGSFFIAPAHAQQLDLQSGDNVTVGGTGTSGTYLGVPISNTTSAYTNVTTVTNSVFTLNSGGGSNFSGNGAGLDANGGTVNVTGGTLGGFYGLFASSTSVNISGGTLQGFIDGYEASSGGTANITGGTFSGVVGPAFSLSSNSFATISGGSFSQGRFGSFGVGTGSTIDLLGTFSQTAPITGGSGTITGTLLDGETLTAAYNVSPGGLIEFNANPVPEASSVVSLGLLLVLGLGGLALSARRRNVKAAQ